MKQTRKSVISGSFLKIQNLGFSKKRDLREIVGISLLVLVCFFVGSRGGEREEGLMRCVLGRGKGEEREERVKKLKWFVFPFAELLAGVFRFKNLVPPSIIWIMK